MAFSRDYIDYCTVHACSVSSFFNRNVAKRCKAISIFEMVSSEIDSALEGKVGGDPNCIDPVGRE